MGPANHGENDRNRDVDLRGRPVARQRGGKRKPQRQGRDRTNEFHHPHDHQIHHPADITRYAAEGEAQYERYHDPDESDRQRRSCRIQGAREDVASNLIGAEEMYLASVNAEQMNIGLEQIEQLVGFALHKPSHGMELAFIGGRYAAQRYRVALGLPAIDEGSGMEGAGAVEEVNAHGRPLRVAQVPRVGSVWREKLRNQRDNQENSEQAQAEDRHVVTPELPPHELPVGGDLVVARTRTRDGRCAIHFVDSGRAARQRAPSSRMRGSSQMRSKSETSVPMTTKTQ